MADCTRVSEEELERRESYIRAGHRERHILDPFTWSYPYKGAGTMVGLGLVSAYLLNIWTKKPYYWALYPRMAGFAVLAAAGYGMGSLRVFHYKTRDAVIEHYMHIHPDDFDHFKDRNGRAFSQILLPWYPRRAQYSKFQ